MNRIRATYDIFGIVQGVGFRPSVYRVARAEGLSGWVQNRSGCVRLCLVGDGRAVNGFIRRMETIAPRQARVDRVERIESHAVQDDEFGGAFQIVESTGTDALDVTMPSDLAICADCQHEIQDPRARRYNYAFTTCTNCGPRFSIIRALPYDRPNTTMSGFPMCRSCEAEYRDPADRRFHAQPNACPECGPQLDLWDAEGRALASRHEALLATAGAIRHGKVAAVKGIGGFHLVVDARNEDAVLRLR